MEENYNTGTYSTSGINPFHIVLIVVLALYVLSPVDAVPGPIDDIALMILAWRSHLLGR